jgi:hypothetical protein
MSNLTIPPLGHNKKETGPYPFADEPELSAIEKEQLLADWQRFWANGFKQSYFTERLYRSLISLCSFTAHRDRDTFWRFYCDADLLRLKLLMAQFAADRRSAEYGTTAWLDGPAADLKQAMCAQAARLYEPLSQVLEDLAFKHAELGQAWRQFALQAGLPDPGFPAAYQVGENTRNLLAYAAHIALHNVKPLSGLQYRFPAPPFYQETGSIEPLVVIKQQT